MAQFESIRTAKRFDRAKASPETNSPPPVEKLFWLSIKSFIVHFKSLLAISLFPAALLGGGTFAGAMVYSSYGHFVSKFGLPLPVSSIYAIGAGYGVLLLFGLAAEILFLTAWHRVVLLEERDALLRTTLVWRKRHWLALVRLLCLSLAFSALGYFLWFLYWNHTIAGIYYTIIARGSLYPAYILLGILGLLIAGILMRFSYTLPAAAIGRPFNLRQSWRETRGQGLRLAATFAILTAFSCSLFGALLFGVGYFLFESSFLGTSQLEQSVRVITVLTAFGFSVILAQAPIFAVIAHSFRLNSGWSPDEEAIARFE